MGILDGLANLDLLDEKNDLEVSIGMNMMPRWQELNIELDEMICEIRKLKYEKSRLSEMTYEISR